tara:strand:- start:37063 stop:40191 length:3129 start_codon:yes stop_codon:yes gene_type:complete
MKSSKLFFSLFFIFSIVSISKAQQKCGFDGIREQQLQDSNFAGIAQQAELKLQKAIRERDLSKMNGTVLTIPIVVHVLHLGETVGAGTNISDAQIQSSIDNLNDYYRGQIATSPIDFEIEFTLAQRDPNCNATTGINRINASGLPGYLDYGVNVANTNGADYSDIVALSSWPQTDYLNVWIVTELDGNDGGYGYQGYAYFYNETFSTHGSVMMSSVFGYDPGNTNGWGLNSNGDNSTVVHEVGHFFHLYHTFQGDGTGSTCPLDSIVGTDSDGCADTVPHKRETSTCPTNNSCTGSPWIDNNTINNIMSYYSCSDRLTNDQKTRVRAAMEGTSIASSKGAEPLDLSYEAPSVVCSVNPAADLTANYAGITNVELNGISFTSSTAANDGGNIDESGNCSNYFEIDTSVSNTLNVELGPNLNQLGVWIDWNDDGDFDDDSEEQYPVTQGISGYSNIAINLTYPTLIPYNDYVRIRIVNDLDTGYGLNPIDSACYQSLAYGQSEDYSIYIEPSVLPTTYTYNNAWSPSNPIGTSTSSDTIIIETGTANISANTDCNSLTVNPGAALTIDSGITLTSNTVDLNSTSQLFSSLVSDGTITGLVNYNRHVSLVGLEVGGTNDLISAPIPGQLFPAFAALNSSNLPESGSIRAFAPYNTSAGAYQNYDLVTNALTTIDSGVGYRTATTDAGTLTFSGTPIINDVLDLPISDAATGYAWNLIGNPYPSYIDFNEFFTANAAEFATGSAFQAVYGYDGNADDGWTVWNLATIADGTITELLAPGQAFFVKSKSGGGLVDFTTSMRRVGNSDDFIAGRNEESNVALCKLNLESSSKSVSTQIYFIEGTTRGLDSGYDAGSYKGSAGDFSIFSNLVDNNSGLDMAIQSLPYNDLNNVIIPIGINAQANEQLTISMDNVTSLPSGVNVYLNDTAENTFTLLNTSNYVFIATEVLLGTGRFYIQYSTEALSIKGNDLSSLQIYASTTPKKIVVNGLLANETIAHIYDIQGRMILSKELNPLQVINHINVSSFSTGIYMIRLIDGNLIKTQKLIIK